MIRKRYFALAVGLFCAALTAGCNRNACVSECGSVCGGSMQGCGISSGYHGIGGFYGGFDISTYNPRHTYYAEGNGMRVERLKGSPDPVKSGKAPEKIRIRETPAVTVSESAKIPSDAKKEPISDIPVVDVDEIEKKPAARKPNSAMPPLDIPVTDVPAPNPAQPEQTIPDLPDVVIPMAPVDKKPAPSEPQSSPSEDPKLPDAVEEPNPSTAPIVEIPISDVEDSDAPAPPATAPVQPTSATVLPELSMPKLP